MRAVLPLVLESLRAHAATLEDGEVSEALVRLEAARGLEPMQSAALAMLRAVETRLAREGLNTSTALTASPDCVAALRYCAARNERMGTACIQARTDLYELLADTLEAAQDDAPTYGPAVGEA